MLLLQAACWHTHLCDSKVSWPLGLSDKNIFFFISAFLQQWSLHYICDWTLQRRITDESVSRLKGTLSHYGGVCSISGLVWALKNNGAWQWISKAGKHAATLCTLCHFIDSFKVRASVIFLLLLLWNNWRQGYPVSLAFLSLLLLSVQQNVTGWGSEPQLK